MNRNSFGPGVGLALTTMAMSSALNGCAPFANESLPPLNVAPESHKQVLKLDARNAVAYWVLESPGLDEAAPTLIVCHGLNGDFGQMLEMVPLDGCRVIGFDMPAHGASPALEGSTHDLSIGADIIHELVKHVPASSPIVVVGYSMGGMETLTYAARYAQDDDVSNFVIVCSQNTPVSEKRLDPLLKLSGIFGPESNVSPPKLEYADSAENFFIDPQAIAPAIENGFITVICAQHDEIMSPGSAQSLVASLSPKSEQVFLQNERHALSSNGQKSVRAAVRHCMDSCSK